ncbi:hypothetical protein D6D13_08817 [Aureobasidium pullulans]|uniref:Uncharacterized protein n=1 Tax=Aureobasidium pullulans TaxID=5580 RepID=A0A4S9C502_AURPU|nr:hypothetical protein D6D13_08817 [Aureobasidium pullulans]
MFAASTHAERIEQTPSGLLERGFSRPGYAGLVPERFGDAASFQPAVKAPAEEGQNPTEQQVEK